MRLLYIYGEPDLARIREAKALASIDELVKPVYSDFPVTARVLAYDAIPKTLCDHASVGAKTSLEGLAAALKWCLGAEDDPRVQTITKSLENIFGYGVKELDTVDITEENKLRDLKKASVRFKLDQPGDSRDR